MIKKKDLFDKIIERKNTNCYKFDTMAAQNIIEDVIPMWVADMDFETVPEVKAALIEAAEHGIYGYTFTGNDYFKAISTWFYESFGWEVKKEWMTQTPGVVFSLAAAVRAYTEEGDGVLIQRPVYYPFFNVIEENNRKVINNPLYFDGKRYRIDFEDFERKILENGVKLFLLCNPHNPVSRVWEECELKKMGEICIKHDVFIVADEIHCDFVYEGHKHISFASLGEEYARQCMICTAPSKTFNLAGLQISNIFIINEHKRGIWEKELERCAFHQPTLFGIRACQAAYNHGRPWLSDLLLYLKNNIDYVKSYLDEHIQTIKLVEPEGTYLLWLDCRKLNLSSEELKDFFLQKAKVWMNEGSMFGVEGNGFMRMNIACPLQVVKEAMERIRNAVNEII